MALLATQQIVSGGLVATFAAATVTVGDTFACDGVTFLAVKNGSGGSINVTLKSKATARPGLVVTDKVIAVADGVTAFISVDPTGFADRSAGNVATAICSSVTSVTVAAIHS